MKLISHITQQMQLRPLTALAIGSGAGAAVGLKVLPPSFCALLLLALLFLSNRRRILLAAGFLLACISGYLRFSGNRDIDEKLSRRPMWAEGIFVCTDARFSKLPDLEMPKQQRGVLSLPGIGTFPVTATFPPAAERPFYGDRFAVEGQLFPPSPSALIADCDGKITGATEPPFGKIRRMQVQSAKFLGSEHGLRRALLLWRDTLLKRMLAHLDGTLVRSQTARLFLGTSAGAPPEVRNRYVSAGTIHLFAVSGIHVAVLSGLLLFLLRPLPFRLRYCAVAALVWLYVFCAGGAYSAIRAGAMISAWALCRALLLYSPGWNILCLGGSIILWLDPQAVTDLGVQYSFVITAALILGAERLRDLRRSGEWQLQLMTEHNAETEKYRRFQRRLIRWAALPFSAVVAFAASSGISLYAQSLFAPGGMAANLLLPLITPLLFIAMVGKMLVGWISPFLDRLGAWFITFSFTLLDRLCEIVISVFGRISAVRPELWEIALFYAAFFFALGSRRFRSALAGSVIALLMLLSWPLRGNLHREELWILSPGCERPAMTVQIPRGSTQALILNAPDFNCGITASQALRKIGVTEAEVWLSAGTTAAGGGLAALRSGGLKITRLHIPEKCSPALRALIAQSAPDQLAADTLGSFADVSGSTVTERVTDSGRSVRIDSGKGMNRSVTLPWSAPPVWVSFAGAEPRPR